MSANKVLILGIDSMDKRLLQKYLHEMQTFKEISEESPRLELRSVFPPDSDTAWASVYTGLNPANHGVVTFVDPLEKSLKIQTQDVDPASFRGKTFWDIIGRYGKKSLILLPHICYPSWEINGIMVSRSRVLDDISITPKDLMIDFNIKELIPPKGVPKKDTASLRKLIEDYKKLLQNETKFFSEMLQQNDWDLGFVYSSALDAIQHYFWNYSDPTDPTYPTPNEFQNVIKEFYIMYDKMVKTLTKLVDEDTIVIILSDHGHDSRPKIVVNINEILRRMGVLKVKGSVSHTILEKTKKRVIKAISEWNLGWLASKILKAYPKAKDLFVHSSAIDFESSIAYTTDLSGIKAYTYGGIKIKANNLDENEYEQLRTEIIKKIQDLKDPKTNENVVEWVLRREALYHGKYLDKYPDIVIQLKPGYGVGHSVKGKIFEKAYTSNVVPGSHRGDTPIFFMLNAGREVKKDHITLMDIAPTILDIFGIDWRRFDFDGRNIFK